MRRRLLLLLVLVAVSCSCDVFAQDVSKVSSIEIISKWGGLGRPSETNSVIERRGDSFLRGRDIVPTSSIRALLDAIAEAPNPTPNLRDLGLTPDVLRQRARTVETPRYEGTPTLTQRQRRLFETTFVDQRIVQSLLDEMAKSRHTDDNPYTCVLITFTSGTKVKIVSGSQFAYMLPWKVKSDTQEHVAFNIDISRSIAALMPRGATNKGRIAEWDFTAPLAQEISTRIEDQINLLGVEEQCGPALAQLRTRYKILSAEINGFHHPEYGKDWEHGDPGVRNLHASLHLAESPPNLTILLVLPYRQGKVVGVEEFLEKIGTYEDQVKRIPGILNFIDMHPTVPFRISYVDGSSLGDKGLETFSADMKAIGRSNLPQQIAQSKSAVTLLITGKQYSESYWLLFPDSKMLLWRYDGPSGLLGWSEKAFETKECASYGEVFGGCVGQVMPSEVLKSAASRR